MTATTRGVLTLMILLSLAGCGARRTSISGTVTRGGEPLVWAKEGGHLLVLFIPEDRVADKSVYRADTDRDTGGFTIVAIPMGKYRVAIQQFDETHNDALGHVYNPGATELTAEVTSDGQVIELDLPKHLPKGKTPRR